MRKPSMFSRDYEKKMRKIKIRNRILISLGAIIIIGGVTFFFLGSSFENPSEYFKNLLKSDNSEKSKDNTKEKNESTNNEENIDKEEVEEKEENLTKDIDLGNGKFVKLNFKEIDGKIQFENIEDNGNNIAFDIAPNKINSVILDKDTQTVYLSDTSGALIDISASTYTSSNGTVFNKESILKQKSDYVWHEAPKFLNDNTIVYLSELPWFNKTDKYLWTIDLKTKNHMNMNVQGQNITLGNLTDKGLEVTIDGTLKYINQDQRLIN